MHRFLDSHNMLEYSKFDENKESELDVSTLASYSLATDGSTRTNCQDYYLII
jgi:hypothetical protein